MTHTHNHACHSGHGLDRAALPSSHGWLVLILLLGATVWCYLPGLNGPFLLDDYLNIPRTALDTFTWEEIKSKALWEQGLGARSLSNLSFSLTQRLSGFEPFPFKLQNLLIHLLNGLLIFVLIQRLLALNPDRSPKQARYLALAVTALWLLHPLQVSTVLYAMQRMTLLSSLFILLALNGYVQGRLIARHRPARGAMLMTANLMVFGTLGFLSKDNGALVFFYIAAIEFFFFRLAFQSTHERRLVGGFLTLLVLLPILVAGIYLGLHWDRYVNYAPRDFDLTQRLLTQIHALWFYLKLILVPLPHWMSLFHDAFPIQKTLDWLTLLMGAGLLALIGLGLALRSRAAEIGFGIFLFFIGHLMESTFLPLEMVFEHRNYLALLGPALIVVLLICRLSLSPKPLHVSVALISIIMVLLVIATHHRAYLWGDLRRIYATDYAQRPESPRVLLGQANIAFLSGERTAAIVYLRELQEAQPLEPGTFINEILFRCDYPPLPGGLFETALDLLDTGRLTPYTASSLRVLALKKGVGACPALSSVQLQTLAEHARLGASRGFWRTQLPIEVTHACVRFLDFKQGLTPSELSKILDRAGLSKGLYEQTVGDFLSFAQRVGRADAFARLVEGLPEPHQSRVQAIIEKKR